MLQVSEEEGTFLTTRNEEIEMHFFSLTTLKHFIADSYICMSFLCTSKYIILNKSKQEIIIIIINKKA